MPFSLFLALKYLKPKRSFISVVTTISVMGVALGVAILLIVMSVMEGFGVMWREKILDFSAHLSVSHTSGVLENPSEVAERVRGIQGVDGAAPYVESVVLIRSDDRIVPGLAAGYGEGGAGVVTRIPESLVYGEFDLSGDGVVVGIEMAHELRVSVGDEVLVYSPKCVMSSDEIHLPEELRVVGIFRLGMWEFDRRFMMTSIDTARELYGMESGAREIRVTAKEPDPVKVRALALNIETELGPEYSALTWMDMKSALFGALRVEKDLMRFLLACIAVVAFFCVANTLIVITVQKTSAIGLLKALGFSAPRIMGVFMWHGMIQCLTGSALGIGIGMLVVEYRNRILGLLGRLFNYEMFPAKIYELSELPAKTTVGDVVQIIVLVTILCLVATIIPAARAASLDPVEALRSE